jgi:predicted nucleic acid-binding protein
MTRVAGKGSAAVFDSSPLIFLSRIGLLRETATLYSESFVPESVKAEVVDIGRRIGAPETSEIEALLDDDTLTVMKAPKTPLSRTLDSNRGLSAADRDSIVLAFERDAHLLADDAAVRTAARHLGIPLGGTLSVIFSLVDTGVVAAGDGVRQLDRLIDEGWYCSAKLYRMARRALERA